MVSPNRADVTITWPTMVSGQLSRTPSEIKVHQHEYRHDMVVIDYHVETAVVARYKEGTPIKVQWGTPPGKVETFYGSVLFIRPHVQNEKHLMRVACIGTSYKAKATGPAAHSDITVEHFFDLAAKKLHLDLVRQKATLKWPLIARPTCETEWEQLVRLAQRIGCTFYVNKTTAFLYDPVDVLLDNTDAWPILTYNYGRQSDYSGDVLSFTPYLGDQGAPGMMKRGRTISSVDPRNSKVLHANDMTSGVPTLASHTEKARFTTALTGQPAYSVAEAQARLEGRSAKHRWIMKAEAHCYGDVRLRQGTGVHILGVSKESDGLWYVGGAEHTLSFENHPSYAKYYTNLTLLRDSREQDFHPDATVPRQRNKLQPVGVQRNKRDSSAVYDSGFWISSRPTRVIL